MKSSKESESKLLILKKAEKDLLKIAKSYPVYYPKLQEFILGNLSLPIKVDGDRIKCFTNYKPPLYELRMFGPVHFRAFFRIYNEARQIELERVITKTDAEKVLKNYFS